MEKYLKKVTYKRRSNILRSNYFFKCFCKLRRPNKNMYFLYFIRDRKPVQTYAYACAYTSKMFNPPCALMNTTISARVCNTILKRKSLERIGGKKVKICVSPIQDGLRRNFTRTYAVSKSTSAVANTNYPQSGSYQERCEG